MQTPISNAEVQSLLGAKALGLLAAVGIAGVTGAIGVIVVSSQAAPVDAPAPVEAPPPVKRPRLSSTTDVRTRPLHRAHLTAATRVDCADCHDLRATDFHVPGIDRCIGCHKDHEPGVHRGTDQASCLTCHDFLTGTARCESCHDEPQRAHPAIAIHRKQGCANCHAVHPRRDFKPADCVGCHDTRATAHPAGGAGKAACLVCHVPHRPAREARCERCHVAGVDTRIKIPATALFRGHDRCVQCHAGHGFSRATVKACRDCHAGKHVLAETKHTACTGCHDPHAAKAPPRCTTCHAAIAATSKHPHDARGRDCVGCHPPHGDVRVVLGCTDRCHGDKRDGHGTTTCRDCHARHRFLPTETAPALCVGCHARPQGHAPAIATSDGHARCTACHTSAAHHPAAERPACATCHRVEAATVPAGHADCKKCHDVHSGQRRPEAARCENCHADRATTPHVNAPGGCRACHRPHGPGGPATRPACTSCHAQLGGLHVSPTHRTCTGCHTAHAPKVTSRATCVRCHADRRDHVPAAPLCQACHPFRGGP